MVDSDKQIELEIQALIAEYQVVRDEILHHIASGGQILALSLTSAAIAIPLLVAQTSSLPVVAVIAGLYTLAFVYSVIGMEFARGAYYVNSESNYINKTLAHKINTRLQVQPKFSLLQFEASNREARRGFAAFYLSSVSSVGLSMLILIPSLASLWFAEFLSATPAASIAPQNTGTQLLATALGPLRAVAWAAFFLSLLAQILSAVHSLRSGYVSPRVEKASDNAPHSETRRGVPR